MHGKINKNLGKLKTGDFQYENQSLFYIFILLSIAVTVISGCSKTPSKISSGKSAASQSNSHITMSKLTSLKNYESITTGAITTTIDKIHNLNNWQEEIITKGTGAKSTYSFTRDVNGVFYAILTFHSSPQGLKWFKEPSSFKARAGSQLRLFSGFVITDIAPPMRPVFVKYAVVANRQSIEYREINPYNEILGTFWIGKKTGALLEYLNPSVDIGSTGLNSRMNFIVKKIGKIHVFKTPLVSSIP